MPLYEYRCSDCNREFDLLRPMEFSNKTGDCPSCGKPSMRKLSLIARVARGGASESASAETGDYPGPACDSGGDACCGGGACASMN